MKRAAPEFGAAFRRLSKKPCGLFRQLSYIQATLPYPACTVSFPTYTPPEMTDSISFPPCAAEILQSF